MLDYVPSYERAKPRARREPERSRIEKTQRFFEVIPELPAVSPDYATRTGREGGFANAKATPQGEEDVSIEIEPLNDVQRELTKQEKEALGDVAAEAQYRVLTQKWQVLQRALEVPGTETNVTEIISELAKLKNLLKQEMSLELRGKLMTSTEQISKRLSGQRYKDLMYKEQEYKGDVIAEKQHLILTQRWEELQQALEQPGTPTNITEIISDLSVLSDLLDRAMSADAKKRLRDYVVTVRERLSQEPYPSLYQKEKERKGDTAAEKAFADFKKKFNAYKDTKQSGLSQSILEVVDALSFLRGEILPHKLMSASLRKELTEYVQDMTTQLFEGPHAKQIREEQQRAANIHSIFLSSKLLLRDLDRRDQVSEELESVRQQKKDPTTTHIKLSHPLNKSVFTSNSAVEQTISELRACVSRYQDTQALSPTERAELTEMGEILTAYDAAPIDTHKRFQESLRALDEVVDYYEKPEEMMQRLSQTGVDRERRFNERTREMIVREERMERETAEMKVERLRFEALLSLVNRNPRLIAAYQELRTKGEVKTALEPPEYTLVHRMWRYHDVEKQILKFVVETPHREPLPRMLAEQTRFPKPIEDIDHETKILEERLARQVKHPILAKKWSEQQLQWDQLYASYSAAIKYQEDIALIDSEDLVTASPLKGRVQRIITSLDTIMDAHLEHLTGRCKQELNKLELTLSFFTRDRISAPPTKEYYYHYGEANSQYARLYANVQAIRTSHPLIIRQPGAKQLFDRLETIKTELASLAPSDKSFKQAA